ncbi:MAG: endo alpha-1,4 polygalactosaminidase, partial [Alphaproteobacteria bacterium]|nr:endo alpha-1,4 polygalactosaminidase [Alphaproteobacteria bacterium]
MSSITLSKTTLILSVVLMSFAIIAGVVLARPATGKNATWAVYYTDKLPYSRFVGYDIVAFDSDSYPAFKDQRRKDQIILGYLSTTEAETYRDYYDTIKGMNLFVGKSDLWDGHMILDIRKPEWRKYFINTLVPQVLNKGFDGIMLDTIDTVLYMEEEHPKEFKGMKEAAIQFIIELRQAYPNTKLMLNRGFPILQEVAPYVDYLLAESIRVEYNFDNNTAKYFPQDYYENVVAEIQAARAKNPKL